MVQDNKFEFSYKVYADAAELDSQDAMLLDKARKITVQAYAPYSKFYVGAAALLQNGDVVTGTNQENASYPVGTCAERVLLGTLAGLHPGEAIRSMAISYASETVKSDHPISPCGMCRQALLEYEARVSSPIRLILAGQSGEVYIINTAAQLLPFAFTSSELK